MHAFQYYRPQCLKIHTPLTSPLPSYVKQVIITRKFPLHILLDPLLPPSLTHLTLSPGFNQHVNSLPPTLTYLKFGWWFNRPVDCLPDSLIHLQFGDFFDQSVNHLPPSLKYLQFGHYFNHTVDSLPPSLTTLIFGEWFSHPLFSLPSSLTKLMFCMDSRFNHPIEIPPYIQEISFGKNFKQPIYLPFTIRTIEISSSYPHLERLEERLQNTIVKLTTFNNPLELV